jgi:hypothetical protein
MKTTSLESIARRSGAWIMGAAQQIAAMRRLFPGCVKFHDPAEGRWTRPDHLSDGEGHNGGAWYYENAEMPPDRFYSETEDEAWLNLWDDVGEPDDLKAVRS